MAFSSRNKISFFERLTGAISLPDEPTFATNEVFEPAATTRPTSGYLYQEEEDEPEEEGELTVDVYQKEAEIIIQTMIAGVKPEDLTVNITREVVTIRGKRDQPEKVRLITILNKNYIGVLLLELSFYQPKSIPKKPRRRKNTAY